MRTTIARIGATGAGAVLALGLFVAAPPAGASSSGNHGVNSADSTCFTATGHTQGRSHSDPDGMSNGGADKPGCTGGLDADRDGNNGCGNDADREDDNNGWCGRKPHGDNDQAATPPPSTSTTSTSTTTTTTTTAPPAVTVSPFITGLTDCQVDPNEASDCPASAQASTTSAPLSVAATGPAPAGGSVAGTDIAGAAAGNPDDTAGVDTTSTTAPATQVLGETMSRPSSLPRTGAAVGGLALVGLGLVASGRLTSLARRLLRIG
ncbi:MAG: hypothetical protein LC792_26820 [Actinobacteria bacterium]|nr:hypothetical protein [Actinomycetota bacterium]